MLKSKGSVLGRISGLVRASSIAAVAMLGAGCGFPVYKQPLTAANSVLLERAAVYARVDERGVGVEWQATSVPDQYHPNPVSGSDILVRSAIDALAASIVKAAFDAVPSSRAEAGASKLLAANFDHKRMLSSLHRELQTNLGALPLFSVSPPVKPVDAERDWVVANFSEDTVVLASTEHALTADMRSLDIALVVVILSRNPAPGYKPNIPRTRAGNTIIYRNRLEYHSNALSIATGEPKDDDYLAVWSASNGKLLHDELTKGFATLGEMLTLDLQDTSALQAKQPTTVLRQEGDRVLVRINKGPFPGTLSSAPTNYVRPAANTAAYVKK